MYQERGSESIKPLQSYVLGVRIRSVCLGYTHSACTPTYLKTDTCIHVLPLVGMAHAFV